MSLLTAIRSLFRYAAVRHPEHAGVFGRVLSIPPKRFHRRTITFLSTEGAKAVIEAPPQERWEGRRDRAMLILTIRAGLRVSELLAVNCGDVGRRAAAHWARWRTASPFRSSPSCSASAPRRSPTPAQLKVDYAAYVARRP